MHSASCIATLVVPYLHSSYKMTRCRICKDSKQKVTKDKMCERCEGLILARQELGEVVYEVFREEFPKYYEELKETEQKTDEQIKSELLEYDKTEFEKELRSSLRKPKRGRYRHYGKICNTYACKK